MQPPAIQQKKPYNLKRLLWIAAAAVITFCLCIISLGIFGSRDDQAPTPTFAPDHAATVVINAPTSTTLSEPTAVPTQPILGETRDQPYPADAVVEIGDDMQLSILGVARPANDLVEQGNMFNNTPTPDQEYLVVRLHVQCNKPSNDKCTFSGWYFHAVGADGLVRDEASVAGIPEDLDSTTEFFGGASIEGNLVFLVPAGDARVVLFYEPLFFGSPIYIALQ